MEPTTAEGWRVLGCCVVVLYFLWTGFVLYACIRTGFHEPLATGTLARTAFAGVVGFVAYLALRHWVDY
jgi:hypothetical protein